MEFLSLKGDCTGSSDCQIVGNHMHWLKSVKFISSMSVQYHIISEMYVHFIPVYRCCDGSIQILSLSVWYGCFGFLPVCMIWVFVMEKILSRFLS